MKNKSLLKPQRKEYQCLVVISFLLGVWIITWLVNKSRWDKISFVDQFIMVSCVSSIAHLFTEKRLPHPSPLHHFLSLSERTNQTWQFKLQLPFCPICLCAFVQGYGGLRGAVSFSLVLLLNRDEVPAKDAIFTAVFMFIMFTVFVQVLWNSICGLVTPCLWRF